MDSLHPNPTNLPPHAAENHLQDEDQPSEYQLHNGRDLFDVVDYRALESGVYVEQYVECDSSAVDGSEAGFAA